MKDVRLERLAQLICRYSVEVKKGDVIVINYDPVAEPAAKEVYREVLALGGHPMLDATPGWVQEIFYKEAQPHQLDYTNQFQLYEAKHTHARIVFHASSNTRRNSGVDAKLIARAHKSRKPILETYFGRMAKKEWTFCIAPFPTEADAQEADMSLSDYEDFVYKTLMVHKPNPVAAWKKVSAAQAIIAKKLNRFSKLHVLGEDTDLHMSIQGRNWVNCDGHANLPDGEIFTGPVEDTVEGTIRYTHPAIYQGREVTDVRLTFRKGAVIKASAEKGEDLLNELIYMDPGARYVGEFAIGTNRNIKRFTRSILFDEKTGGSIHMALGRSIPESGGVNKSGLHWDMIKDMRKGGMIYGDGKLIYRNGKFLI